MITVILCFLAAASEALAAPKRITPAALLRARFCALENAGVGAKSTRGRILLYSECCKNPQRSHESRVVHQAPSCQNAGKAQKFVPLRVIWGIQVQSMKALATYIGRKEVFRDSSYQ